jgi:hypothetical protein
MDAQDDIDILQLDAIDKMDEFSIREEIVQYNEYNEVEPEQQSLSQVSSGV